MQGLSRPLSLAPIALEALVRMLAAALSGLGLLFGVSLSLGQGNLLRTVTIFILWCEGNPVPSGPRVQTQNREGTVVLKMRLYKPFIINNFHGVSVGNPHQYSPKSSIGKVSYNVR